MLLLKDLRSQVCIGGNSRNDIGEGKVYRLLAKSICKARVGPSERVFSTMYRVHEGVMLWFLVVAFLDL